MKGYTAWVNGSMATRSNGWWSAQIASVGRAGGLVLVKAIPNSDNGGNGAGGGGGSNPQSAQSVNTQATVQAQ